MGNSGTEHKHSNPSAGDHAVESSIVRRVRELEAETNTAFVTELLETYLSQADQRIARLRTAFRESNHEKVHFEAHTLKGGSLSLGASRLADLLQKIEDRAEGGTLAGLEGVIQDMETEFGKTREALLTTKEELKKKGRSGS